NKVEQKIDSLVTKNDHLRLFRRLFIGNAADCYCDKQDRILLPPTLRQYAGLTKEIVLVGVVGHFEIWDREKWENERARFEQDRDAPEVKEIIASIGL
ncbi:MAG: division/cell wall cluster transcriptional repressor MraZ, partial [Desulfobacterales bacterium]